MIRQGKPVPREKVLIMNPPEGPGISLTLSLDFFRTETDQEGRFVFSSMPPGKFHVWRMVGNSYYEPQAVDVEAGKTTVFRHGINGRTLKGRFITSDSSEAVWKTGPRFRLASKTKPFIGGDTPNTSRMPVNFPVMISPNGEFQITDVPAGLYELTSELMEDGSDDLVRGGAIIGRVTREITVPDPEGDRDAALDLGELIVQMSPVAKAESPMP